MPIVKGGRFSFINLGDTPSSYSGEALKFVRVNAGETALEFSTVSGATDELVSIDSGATAGYIGSASSDGVLRTSSPLTYSDGGDFVTLGIDESAIDHGSIGGLSDDDHTQYILADGTRELTGDWDAGSFALTMDQLFVTGTSDVVTVTLKEFSGQTADIFEVLNASGNELFHIKGTGEVDITHVATADEEVALDIMVDAAGFADIVGIEIDYTTGAVPALAEEEIILVGIDQSAAIAGSEIAALEVVPTEGDSTIYALETGILVNPIKQLSGTFGDMRSALVNITDRLTEFTSTGTNIQMFASNSDTVTVGNLTKFEEIEFLLAIAASGAGIKPTFHYSTGIGAWTEFFPGDTSRGLRQNGVIIWDAALIPLWATGLASEYLIRITRNRVSLTTPPTESLVQIATAVEFGWNVTGDIIVNDIVAAGLNVTGNTTFVLPTTNLIFIDATRSGSETTRVIDLDIADSSTGHMRYLDFDVGITAAGSKEIIDIDATNNSTGKLTGINIFLNHSGSGNTEGIRLDVSNNGSGDQAGEVIVITDSGTSVRDSRAWWLFASQNNVNGTMVGLDIEESGNQLLTAAMRITATGGGISTGLFFLSDGANFTTGIDLSGATTTTDLKTNSNLIFTLPTTKFIDIDVTRSGSESTQIIDMDITNTSSGNFNYFDINETHTSGNITAINISMSGTTGDSIPVYSYAETTGIGGDAYGFQTEASSTGGGDIFGFYALAYDQSGQTSANVIGGKIELNKDVVGSTATGLLITEGGAQAVDTAINFLGTYTTGIDLSNATITNAILLASGDTIGISTDTDLLTLTSANLVVAGALTLSTGTSVNEFSIDGTLGGNSDDALPTEKAVKTYVDTQLTAEDLDYAGDSGTGAVDLDSQTFTIAGTSNEIETSASGQTLTVGIVTSPTLDGTNITGVASIDVADESSDTTTFPLFATSATGAIAPKTGSNLTFNSSTGLLTTTTATIGNVTTPQKFNVGDTSDAGSVRMRVENSEGFADFGTDGGLARIYVNNTLKASFSDTATILVDLLRLTSNRINDNSSNAWITSDGSQNTTLAGTLDSGNHTITGSAAQQILVETGVTADNTTWRMIANVEQLKFQLNNDLLSASKNWLTVDRTEQLTDQITFIATTVAITGNETVSGTLDVAGDVEIGNGSFARFRSTDSSRGSIQISYPHLSGDIGAINRPVSVGNNLYIDSGGAYAKANELIGGFAIFFGGNNSDDGEIEFVSLLDTDNSTVTTTSRMLIDSDGLVTIAGALVVGDLVTITSNTSHFAIHIEENSGGEDWQIGVESNGALRFTDSSSATNFIEFRDALSGVTIQNEGDDIDFDITTFSDVAADEPALRLRHARGTVGTPTATQDGDGIGRIQFGGWDTALSTGATIFAEAEGEWGTSEDVSDSPGRLIFATVPNGTSTNTERLRIASDGLITIANILQLGGDQINDSGGSAWITSDASQNTTLAGTLASGSITVTGANATVDLTVATAGGAGTSFELGKLTDTTTTDLTMRSGTNRANNITMVSGSSADRVWSLITTSNVDSGALFLSRFDNAGDIIINAGGGNVGINVASASVALDVGGAITSSGAITDGAASSFTTGTTIGNLTLANGSITDSGGAISFGNESLSTTGAFSAGTGSFDQPNSVAAIPAVTIEQADTSEGTINFIANARASISALTSSTDSVRVEINGSIRRIALYSDA